MHIDTLEVQMPTENINPIHKLTTETDDKYQAFIDIMNHDSDISVIYFGTNDGPEGYTEYESHTTCSSYDTS